MGYQGKKASIAETCFVAPSANIIGDVSIGAKSAVFYGAILTGELPSAHRPSKETNSDLFSQATLERSPSEAIQASRIALSFLAAP
jgi:carbonic anhydrase/acetyltransferase-like protein (isoleucine patch superfamily)